MNYKKSLRQRKDLQIFGNTNEFPEEWKKDRQ